VIWCPFIIFRQTDRLT